MVRVRAFLYNQLTQFFSKLPMEMKWFDFERDFINTLPMNSHWICQWIVPFKKSMEKLVQWINFFILLQVTWILRQDNLIWTPLWIDLIISLLFKEKCKCAWVCHFFFFFFYLWNVLDSICPKYKRDEMVRCRNVFFSRMDGNHVNSIFV